MPLRLCYITDRRALEPRPLLPRIGEAAWAGVDLIQVREKDLETRPLVELVEGALAAARGTQTRIVVNDRLDVALVCGAHGAHVGGQSMPPQVVRAHVGKEFLVGVSCHSLDEALAAESAGADYILLGPIFESPSKIQYGPPLGLGSLRAVTARVKVSVLALGGITLERVKLSLEAGAAGIAAIRLFQECDSLEALVSDLHAQFL